MMMCLGAGSGQTMLELAVTVVVLHFALGMAGRTGHWLNHSKEHCLVGYKGNPNLNRLVWLLATAPHSTCVGHP
jgi:hypothetical protein